jgi:hypothetical protein
MRRCVLLCVFVVNNQVQTRVNPISFAPALLAAFNDVVFAAYMPVQKGAVLH